MHRGDIDFPEPIITALKNDTLVVFAGAGVSMGPPANLPSFKVLAETLAEDTEFAHEIREPFDRFLGKLFDKYPQRRARVQTLLQPSCHNDLHTHLVRLFKDRDSIRIVTTNFETLFESASNALFETTPRIYAAPALPLGRRFNGIVHVHGEISDLDALVLTDSDFGRAYLTEGWARRFLLETFSHYTVLFVGYSHDDTVLTYLARALPPTRIDTRFALVESSTVDAEKWQLLGIHPVSYPQVSPKDYTVLVDGIRSLADLQQRGALEWEQDIKALANSPHPLTMQQRDLAKFILKEAWTTKIFADHASLVDWLNWLDKEGLLDPLFEDGELTECSTKLARWIASRFVLEHHEACLLAIGRHELHINAEFWRSIAFALYGRVLPEPGVFSSWLAVLLASKTKRKFSHALLWLAERAAQLKLPFCILDVFLELARTVLEIKEGRTWLHNDDSKPVPISVDLEFQADVSSLLAVWDLLAPHLDVVSTPLLNALTAHLEKRFRLHAYYGKIEADWDPDSHERSAIETHEQDKHPTTLHILVDAMRECLANVVAKYPGNPNALIQQLSASPVSLLRRLAIHQVSVDDTIPNDDKVKWLLANFALDDGLAHHEVFNLLSKSFKDAQITTKERVVERVLTIKVDWGEVETQAKRTDRAKFNFLSWLARHAPDCPTVSGPLNEIQDKYSDWTPSRYDDFRHPTWGGLVTNKSPWTVDELLARTPAEQIVDLLNFRTGEAFQTTDRDALIEVNRDGLLHNISLAADLNPTWALDLAHALISSGKWNVDLWRGLIRSWEKWGCESEAVKSIFDVVSVPGVYQNNQRKIARLLQMFISELMRSKKVALLPYLERSNRLASILWQSLDRSPTDVGPESDWCTFAINTPAGCITEYWILGHSFLMNDGLLEPQFSDQYLKAFNEILCDETHVGGAGRSILCRYARYLLAALPIWTKQELLPLFSSADDSRLRQAWHGLLFGGPVSAELVQALETDMLRTARNLQILGDIGDASLHHNFAIMFTDLYTGCAGFYVDDPMERWIPELMRHSTDDLRVHFVHSISVLLSELSESEVDDWWKRWLRKHWKNRLDERPFPMSAREAGMLMCWLKHLGSNFPDAVSLAIQMPNVDLDNTHVLFDLARSNLLPLFPDDMARLLLFILNNYPGQHAHIFHEIPRFREELFQHLKDPELQRKIRGEMLRKAFDCPE